MITYGEEMEAKALKKQGWSVAAIARHLNRDRKTIRAYLNDGREPGKRKKPQNNDIFIKYEPYIRSRFTDDPHIWATTLYNEIVGLGYSQSYQSFTYNIRNLSLRPHCEACSNVKGRDTIEIPHPSGEEIQWDWFERRHGPYGTTVYVLLGVLSYSDQIRGVISESMDQAHLIYAIDKILRRFNGTTKIWRTDRLITVVNPQTKDIQETFVPVAKHYGVIVKPCPPRKGNRKGIVEAAVKYVSGNWYRTLSCQNQQEAQVSLDRFLIDIADKRVRYGPDGQKTTVGLLAKTEKLIDLPTPYPATIRVERTVQPNATISFRGNSYSVPPGLSGSTLIVEHRLIDKYIQIYSKNATLISKHEMASDGAGMLIRSDEHHKQLERSVLSVFTTKSPCDKKGNFPPSENSRKLAQELTNISDFEPKVDLTIYEKMTK